MLIGEYDDVGTDQDGLDWEIPVRAWLPGSDDGLGPLNLEPFGEIASETARVSIMKACPLEPRPEHSDDRFSGRGNRQVIGVWPMPHGRAKTCSPGER